MPNTPTDDAREKAQARLAKAETRKSEGEQAWAEHLAHGKAVAKRTARLKSERLARDAGAAEAAASAPPAPSKPARPKRAT